MMRAKNLRVEFAYVRARAVAPLQCCMSYLKRLRLKGICVCNTENQKCCSVADDAFLMGNWRAAVKNAGVLP